MKLRGELHKLLILAGACLLSPIAGAQTPAPPPDPAVIPATPAPGIEPSYVIGPGDVLQIFVWRNPELTITIPVRPDGRITTPLVEEMTAANKTAEELARNIEVELAEYIRSPQVNVIVVTPRGVSSEVKAVGQVRTPQGVPYRAGMTVLDLVLAVGGLTEYAAGNRAKVVRQEGDKRRELRVKLDALVNGGDLRQNFELQAGDVLVVPESYF